uniref:Uncharacterized protein n=1 Tax=Rhizophora mucronata TaxID=61149 RepID=A0A2P2N5N7_RHIMU
MLSRKQLTELSFRFLTSWFYYMDAFSPLCSSIKSHLWVRRKTDDKEQRGQNL